MSDIAIPDDVGLNPSPVAPPVATWQQKALYGCLAAAVCILLLLKVFNPGAANLGVVVTRDGDTFIYRLAPWLALVAVIPCLGFLAIGVIVATIPNKFARLVGAVVILMGLTALVAAAGPQNSELRISKQGFTHTAGFWWNPQTRDVQFTELNSIEVLDGGNERGSPGFVLNCHHRDGKLTQIPKSTVLAAGVKLVVGRAMQLGVAVSIDPALQGVSD